MERIVKVISRYNKYSQYGCGVIIKDKYIITANHVVNDCENIYVFHNNKIYKANIYCKDARLDICVLKSSMEGYSKIEIEKENVSYDQVEIYYYGTNNYSVCKRICEIICNRQITTDAIESVTLNCKLPDGASGAPVYNKEKLLGIIMFSSDTTSSVICPEIFQKCIEKFLETDDVPKKYWLGFISKQISLEYIIRNKLTQLYNNVHGEVVIYSEQENITKDDIILKLNDKLIQNTTVETLSYFSEKEAKVTMIKSKEGKYKNEKSVVNITPKRYPCLFDKPFLSVSNMFK